MYDFGLWIAVGLGSWTLFVFITLLIFIKLDHQKDGLGNIIIASVIAKVIFIIGVCGWMFYGTYLLWN